MRIEEEEEERRGRKQRHDGTGGVNGKESKGFWSSSKTRATSYGREGKRATAGDVKKSRDPGSWPSSCRSKCGWCSPCEPIYVSVQLDMII
ncbi:hypothetical protein Ahy_A09g041356 isoform C [Arachis hypogaea]|uniref:Epidermal patterning factor-like protein n=1 Tax=Arachis hypogaea TaxID=3818 RepID=A0A445BCI1_ARAHY|nr:hypothetical protein Ahy_A09g041356 isoform C [Arachis hypogaea]